MPKAKSDSTKEDYLQILLEPEHFDLKKKGIAKLLGCSESTLYRWDKEIDLDWVKDERRKKYSAKITAVDSAMMKRAREGDVQAAKLVYERFDDWIPVTGTRDLTPKTDEELWARAKQLRGEIESEGKGTSANPTGPGEA